MCTCSREGRGLSSAEFTLLEFPCTGTCTCPHTLTGSSLSGFLQKGYPVSQKDRISESQASAGTLLPASPPVCPSPAQGLWGAGPARAPKPTQADPETPSRPLLLLVSSCPHFLFDPHFTLCSWILTTIAKGPNHLSPRVPTSRWGDLDLWITAVPSMLSRSWKNLCKYLLKNSLMGTQRDDLMK